MSNLDKEDAWGMRIESALVVRRVKVRAWTFSYNTNADVTSQTRREFNGDIWLGFERLTVVPIQSKMVKDGMLSKEEKQWLKVQAFIIITSDPSSYNTCAGP